MKYILKLLACAFMMLLLAVPANAKTLSQVMTSSSSAGQLHAFAAQDSAHSLQEVAQAFAKGEPGKVFRAPKAMTLFKFVLESQVGPMTNGQVAALLSSNRVQVIACIGLINTTGYDDIGKVKWFKRPCVAGEQLITLDGKVVASLWCLNPVEVTVKVVSSSPCSEWHPLPETSNGGLTWIYTTDPAMVKACNPRITLCPGCKEFIDGRRPFKPEGAFLGFIQQSGHDGKLVKGLSTDSRPVGFWTNPGTTLFYCLEQWGRNSRVDFLPAGPS
jgi:hypothetical protein